MKRTVIEDGKEREVIKIACDVTTDNDQGFYIGYRDAMKEGEVEFGAEDNAATNVSKMNKAQLVAHLAEVHGIEATGEETKAELLAMVPTE